MNITQAFITDSLGPSELILIFIVILVLFGPRRLPEVAKMIGKTMEHLRKASQDFRDQVMKIEESAVIDVTPVKSTKTESDDPYMSEYESDVKTLEAKQSDEDIKRDGKDEKYHKESDEKPTEDSNGVLDKQAGRQSGEQNGPIG